MKKVVEKRRVIRVTTLWNYDKERRTLYLRLPESKDDKKGISLNRHHYDYGKRGVEDIRDATDFTPYEEPRLMRLFYDIKWELEEGDSIDLVNLDLIMKVKQVEFDENDLRDFLRQTALGKLSEDEIHALGVENLAVYDKLKNHNT